MKTSLKVIVLAGILTGLAGCISVQSKPIKMAGVEHVAIHTEGWTLFHCVPLFSGNASKDAVSKVAFFRDDVTMEDVQARLVAEANGRTIEDPTYVNVDDVVWEFFGLPIPYVLCYKEINLSANLK